MGTTKYKINEYGEIIREDYFFRQVHGTGAQILPFERKVWKIYLLSLITLGIYGIVVAFAMAKETNISCVEDGKHTRGFWAVIGLSIITLGIYALVWYCKWLNREANFLKRHGKKPQLTGGGYLLIFLLLFAYGFFAEMMQIGLLPEVVVSIIVGIIILTKVVTQHNEVNKTYNEINNFVSKA